MSLAKKVNDVCRDMNGKAAAIVTRMANARYCVLRLRQPAHRRLTELIEGSRVLEDLNVSLSYRKVPVIVRILAN